MPRSCLFRSIFCVAAVCVLGNGVVYAQPAAAYLNQEYEIKAGYFAYFGQLIKWPDAPFEGASREFVIGILGGNPFGSHLRQTGGGFALDAGRVQTQKIQGKPIRVVEYRSVGDFQNNYQPCHILFISRSPATGVVTETLEDRVNAALQKTRGRPVLLVAETTNMDASRQLAQLGVMICYWNNSQANQVSMVINRAVSRREQLMISSRLLGLRIVTVL